MCTPLIEVILRSLLKVSQNILATIVGVRVANNLHNCEDRMLSGGILANIKNTIILFVCPSKSLHKHCFQFRLGPL